jgi:ATP-dependent Clp protease ATP-binding subunit ClpA
MENAAKIASLTKVANNLSDKQKAADAQLALTVLQANKTVNISAPQIKSQAIKIMKGGVARDDTDFVELAAKVSVIKGQDESAEKVLKLLKREEKNLFPRKKPLTFLFAGPSGVGKTELTKIIAQHMTGRAPIVLNMTEYTSPASINQIIGSQMGYVGSESNVELPFDCLESNPYQIILLDEFEKGHKAVQRLFMRVFDEGRLKTNRHAELDFSKAIIIATTNAGYGDTNSLGFGASNTANKRKTKSLINDLKQYFDTELLNRFEYILPFNELSEDTYREILKETYARELERIRLTSRVNLPDEIDADTLDDFVKNYNKSFGARPVFNLVKNYIEDSLP